MIIFNACCEDAEGQIEKEFPAHLSVYFSPSRWKESF